MLLLAAAASALVSGAARAVEVASRGEVGLETRVFQPDDDRDSRDGNVAAVARVRVEARQGDFRARLRGFVRHDEVDRGRSAAFPEEAWLEWKRDRLRLAVGWDMLTWSATEAFHPADVVNSRYFDSNIEGFEKLGEPLAELRVKIGQGNVAAYFMPYFTPPIFPSPRSRLSFTPPSVRLGRALRLQGDGTVTDGRWVSQWGVAAQQTVGDADVSVHVLQHVDRFLPVVGVDTRGGQLRPLFRPVLQVGGTYQQVFAGLIVKLEAAYLMFDRPALAAGTPFVPLDPRALGEDRDHGAIAVGLEYGFSHDNGWETTLLVEGQSIFAEGRGLRGNARIRRELNLFQRDVLAGVRLALQDEADSALLAFLAVDVEDPDQIFANLGYGRRLGEEWSLKTGLRIFHLPPRDAAMPIGFERWHRANQLYLTLLRHF